MCPRKLTAAPQDATRKGRVSAAMRLAIKLRVEEGLTIKEAAGRAGITEQAWHKAMKRQAVRDALEAQASLFIREIDRRRATYRAQAIEVAANLMRNAQSEAVKMRAVEFFTTETRSAPLVSVNIGQPVQGYEYLPPGARLVEIEGTAAELPAAGSGEAQAMHADEEDEQDQ